jgi:hypothetical protein
MKRSSTIRLALALLCSQPAVAHAVVVGVLEQPQCAKPVRTAVRPLFARQGQEWVALKSQAISGGLQLGTSRWTVAFRGHSQGSIVSADSAHFSAGAWYARHHVLAVVAGGALPAMANADPLFGGACGPPENRPLVIVSHENYDIHDWRASPASGLGERILPQFRAAAGQADTCGTGRKAKPWSYGAADLIVSQCIGDTSGNLLARVALDSRRYGCRGQRPAVWSNYLFRVGPDVLLLGKDLTIVDFGDYDGDGAIEVLCWYSAPGEDGYTLFYGDLRRHVDYHWSDP